MALITKRWVVKDVITVARTMVKANTQRDILFNDIVLAYKVALLDVVKSVGLAADPSYYKFIDITVSNTSEFGDQVFDLSSLTDEPELIIALHDAAYGQCVEKGMDEFSSIISTQSIQHSSYNDSIIWTVSGTRMFIKWGANIVANKTTSKKLCYQRVPLFPTDFDSTTEYVDLPDKFIPLLIKNMVSYLMGYIASPEILAQEMAGNLRLGQEAGIVDLQNRNKLASQTTVRES